MNNKKIVIIVLISIIFVISLLIFLQSFKKEHLSHNSEKLIENKTKTCYERNLVFTSAGDKTQFDNLWCGENQEYDIMVVYYGNQEEIYQKYFKKVNYILKRKGSKFQNFNYIYQNYKELLAKYERFFILDDDIVFDVDNINKMFSLSRKYNFEICGPTFKNVPKCKISHKITMSEEKNQFRYTNFIEVNVPLFNRAALDKLMKFYDPILIGWGIDFLYIWANGTEKQNSYALIDAVTCVNPIDDLKGGKRELYNIDKSLSREETYKKFAQKLGIQKVEKKTWKVVPIN